MPAPVTITKPKRATWLGRAGEIVIHHFDTRHDGKRVTVIRWLDGSEQVEVRAINGNGRHGTLSVFSEATLGAPDADAVARAVLEASASL